MIGDWIEQLSETQGTGTLTLIPPPVGKTSFVAEIGEGNPAYYTIINGNDREKGFGIVGANSLTRGLIKSTTGALLNLTGTSTVRCTPIAEMLGGMGGRLHMAHSVANAGTTYIISTRPALRELVDGARVRFRANVTNSSGAALANVDSTGAKPIRKGDFAPVEPYEIRRLDIYTIVYDAEADCWQVQSPVYPPGRNVLINGGFQVWQRGATLTGLQDGQFTADRWRYLTSAGGGSQPTVNASQQEFPATDPSLPGSPPKYIRIEPQGVGSSLGPASHAALVQRIPEVRMFSGQRATTRVWLRSSIAGKRVGFRLRQNFGIEAEASPDAFAVTGQSHLLTSIWTPYDIFWDVPSLSGKEATRANFLALQIYFQWGTDYDSAFGTEGGEGWGAAGSIDLADAKFEPGHLVTPFEQRTFDRELIDCLPYYQESYGYRSNVGATLPNGSEAFHADGSTFTRSIRLVVSMGDTPTITLYNPETGLTGTWRDVTANADRTVSAQLATVNAFHVTGTGAVEGNLIRGHWTAEWEP